MLYGPISIKVSALFCYWVASRIALLYRVDISRILDTFSNSGGERAQQVGVEARCRALEVYGSGEEGEP